jgi:iron-sulfur cluster repair protein YtfE (RIC family)
LDVGGDCRSSTRSPVFSVTSSGHRFRNLFCHNPNDHFLVAPRIAPLYELWLLEEMKNLVEPILEDDHQSLNNLFVELDGELAKTNVARSFELLDLFWARLAMHIRAENLHLFPALAHTSDEKLNGKDNLPTVDGAQEVIERLRRDHDFFMKELANLVKQMRQIANQNVSSEDVDALRQRLSVLRDRLVDHNRLEEEHVYIWPSLLFDHQALVELAEHIKHELNNLPPRFL